MSGAAGGNGGTGGGDGGTGGGGTGGGGAGGDKPWFDGVDAETLGYLQNRGLDKGDARAAALEAIKAHREAEKFVGAPAKELIRLPKDANDPAWKDIRVRLGAGKEAKDYDFVDVKFSDGKGFEPKFADFLRTTFHTHGIPKDAAVTLAKDFAKYIDGIAADANGEDAAVIAKERDTLQKDWGSNFNQNMLIAENAAKALGVPEDVLDTLKSMKGMGHAKVIEMFRNIGEKIGEDRFISGGPHREGVMTVPQAKDRLKELKADQDWVRRVNAGDSTANRELDNLATIIASAKQVEQNF